MAVVFAKVELVNTTLPGPLILLQLMARLPEGNPSSPAIPFNVTGWEVGAPVTSEPASTTGAALFPGNGLPAAPAK